jgi:chromosome partitioning protein
MILTVANLKGGTSKTTSAAFLAHALAERGRRVLVVDADPQASITRWAEMAEWRLPVVGKATGRLHVELEEIVGDRFDAVVIDTPPTDKLRGIVESAIRAATTVLVPIAPTSAEYERTATVQELIEDVGALNRHNRSPLAAALLVRTVAGAASTGVYRDMLTEDGWTVLRGSVPRREVFAQAFGGPVERASATGYGDALDELVKVEVSA